MSAATYVLEVMWDAINWTDETARLLTWEWKRGRDRASQLTGRAIASVLSAQLDDTTGRYASLNAASPLFGNVKPTRKVRLRTTAPVARTQWQGFLDTITPSRDAGAPNTVVLRALGPIGYIASRPSSQAVFTNILGGTAIGDVLDDAGWPGADRTVDAGQVTMARWTNDTDNALKSLRDIEETEQGFISESADGKMVFEDVHHRLLPPHTTSVATFSDAAAAALPYETIDQLDLWTEVFNRFEADVTLFTVQAIATLWQLVGETPSITPAQTREFWALYPGAAAVPQADHVDAWTTPAAVTDVVANAASDGSGADLTGSIAIAATKYGNSMKISLTNNAAVAAFLTTLKARGTAAYRNDPVRIAVEDATSQAAYGKRTFPLGGKFYPTTARARSFCEYGVSRYKDPHAALAITYRASRSAALMTQALTRDVSDRITVVGNNATHGALMGVNGDFYIEAETHRMDQEHIHTVRYELSNADADGGYWVLGVSTLGIATKLAP